MLCRCVAVAEMAKAKVHMRRHLKHTYMLHAIRTRARSTPTMYTYFRARRWWCGVDLVDHVVFGAVVPLVLVLVRVWRTTRSSAGEKGPLGPNEATSKVVFCLVYGSLHSSPFIGQQQRQNHNPSTGTPPPELRTMTIFRVSPHGCPFNFSAAPFVSTPLSPSSRPP